MKEELLRSLFRWSGANVMPKPGWYCNTPCYQFYRPSSGFIALIVYFPHGVDQPCEVEKRQPTGIKFDRKVVDSEAELLELLNWVATP